MELRGKQGLGSSTESFVELSCLGLGRRGVRSAFLAQTRQSFVSLPLFALVPEPRSGVRREATAWPGCGVACVVCSVAALSCPSAGAEAGARLESRARGLRVPLLAASGDGLVAIVVTVFPHDLHGGCSLSVASSRLRRWSGLVQTGASGGFRSMFLQFRGSVPWCLSVVAPVGVVPDLVRVQGLGGSACGPSTRWRSEVAVLAFHVFGVPAALVGEGLVIPTGPCSRGSPPYFLQLGARRRGSSVSDGLRRRLWRRVVVSSSESKCCELWYPSELRVVFCKSSGLL
ncbi:hypothetical protein Taro_027374 [Colocasia esculenta]|uniref:Uncharacterized protein n=1 Tax=Colocasia esculenta TaxID=4460 RepID=A0A843VEC6_COLES|nr:hypothetical protein [Colocasia esculenta]